MILVDTSVWIDHLHVADERLRDALDTDGVGVHVAVIEELAVGSIRDRTTVLDLLSNLRHFPVLSHWELLSMVSAHHLWGRGLSATDAHLLGSVALIPGARLWTRDRRLLTAGEVVGIDCVADRAD